MTLAAVDSFTCDQAEADNELRRNDTAEVVNRQYSIVLVDRVDGRVIAQGRSLDELRAQVLDDDGNPIFASVSELSEVEATAEEAIARWTLSVIGSDADGNNVYGQIIAGADGETADLILAFDRIALGRVGGNKVYPFVLSDSGEVIIDTALIDKLTIGKLVDEDGTLVVEDGKIKAEYIDVDNLQVNYSAIIGSKPPSDADKTGSNTSADTNKVAGTSASTVRDNASAGRDADNRTADWARDNNVTFIDGRKIFTGDAYVDTLQIQGNAVTIPQATSSDSEINVTTGSSQAFLSGLPTLSGPTGAGNNLLVRARGQFIIENSDSDTESSTNISIYIQNGSGGNSFILFLDRISYKVTGNQTKSSTYGLFGDRSYNYYPGTETVEYAFEDVVSTDDFNNIDLVFQASTKRSGGSGIVTLRCVKFMLERIEVKR